MCRSLSTASPRPRSSCHLLQRGRQREQVGRQLKQVGVQGKQQHAGGAINGCSSAEGGRHGGGFESGGLYGLGSCPP